VDDDLLTRLKLLTDVTRLRILGAVAGRPMTATELSAELGVARRDLDRHLARLAEAGLVSATRGGGGTGGGTGGAGSTGSDPARSPAWRLLPEAVGDIGRGLAALEPSVARGVDDEANGDGRWTAEEAKVLRAFVVDGRLIEIPAQPKKRETILRFLLDRCFPEDRDYPEKEVNQRLALWHPDAASLRRYLVDGRYMTRAAGVYRRATPPPIGAA
jgi:DNA-binding transcriptional ArsR family regulator